jgi:hypothetical protein
VIARLGDLFRDKAILRFCGVYRCIEQPAIIFLLDAPSLLPTRSGNEVGSACSKFINRADHADAACDARHFGKL